MRDTSLTALSPVDGRYAPQTSVIAEYFSEFSLIKHRVTVEVEYLLFLSKKSVIPAFTSTETKILKNISETFALTDAEKVKEIEDTIHHDVKAVEYFLQQLFTVHKIKNSEYIHIALTSEDVNNLAYSLSLQSAFKEKILPLQFELIRFLTDLAQKYSVTPMLARTHGQPAVPTTLGKEILVFAHRLKRVMEREKAVQIEGKLSGAVGNFSAHAVAFPGKNWLQLSSEFISSLGLKPSTFTTQILPTESYVELFGALSHFNSVLLDLNQDMWRYISDGYLKQKANSAHVGSSTMPQKVNPIDFENSEGNCGLANALLQYFCEKLPISRLQRDLADSTVKRSFGVAFAHCFLAYTSCLKGLRKIEADTELMERELESHWEVVTEGVQTVLRTTGDDQAYEKLKELSRGKLLSRESLIAFVDTLDLDAKTKDRLYSLTPTAYIGLAKELVAIGVAEVLQDIPKTLTS